MAKEKRQVHWYHWWMKEGHSWYIGKHIQRASGWLFDIPKNQMEEANWQWDKNKEICAGRGGLRKTQGGGHMRKVRLFSSQPGEDGLIIQFNTLPELQFGRTLNTPFAPPPQLCSCVCERSVCFFLSAPNPHALTLKHFEQKLFIPPHMRVMMKSQCVRFREKKFVEEALHQLLCKLISHLVGPTLI